MSSSYVQFLFLFRILGTRVAELESKLKSFELAEPWTNSGNVKFKIDSTVIVRSM